MITAERLQILITQSTQDLSRLMKCEFKDTRFLGITNGGEFCYRVTLPDDAVTKVFVRPADDEVVAGY